MPLRIYKSTLLRYSVLKYTDVKIPHVAGRLPWCHVCVSLKKFFSVSSFFFSICLDACVVSLSVLKIKSQMGSCGNSFGFVKSEKERMHVCSPSAFHLQSHYSHIFFNLPMTKEILERNKQEKSAILLNLLS